MNGIQARKLWKPINMLLPYKKAIFIGTQKSLELYNSAISLPSSASLKKSDQDFVTQTLIAILKTKKWEKIIHIGVRQDYYILDLK